MIALDCGDTQKTFPLEERARLARLQIRRKARRRAQVERAEQIRKEAAQEMAARRALEIQGWAQQKPAERTPTVQNRRARRVSWWDVPALLLFLAVVVMLIVGMVKAPRGERGAAIQNGAR